MKGLNGENERKRETLHSSFVSQACFSKVLLITFTDVFETAIIFSPLDRNMQKDTEVACSARVSSSTP